MNNKALDSLLIGKLMKDGADITGVIQVGANDFYELQFYRQLGIEKVIGFEPVRDALDIFKQKYPEERHVMFPIALGNKNGLQLIHQTTGDAQGSSLLKPTDAYIVEHPEYTIVQKYLVDVKRFSTFYEENSGISHRDYNCLIVDTQGTELDVIKGFDDLIEDFQYIICEVSEKENYDGQASAQEIQHYLELHGFELIDYSDGNNDAYFRRKVAA